MRRTEPPPEEEAVANPSPVDLETIHADIRQLQDAVAGIAEALYGAGGPSRLARKNFPLAIIWSEFELRQQDAALEQRSATPQRKHVNVGVTTLSDHIQQFGG